jgi:anti-sigma factor RsiW
MKCSQARSLFSLYLDGMLTGTEMLPLGAHLDSCDACSRAYSSLRRTQQLLASMGRKKAPDDLALKLRLAISREVARSRPPYFAGLRVRIENLLHAFMVPATAGLASAVVMFGLLMGFLAVPLPVKSADVPLTFSTTPQLEESAFGNTYDSLKDDSLVIEAYVDSNGRVQDYRVLSDPENPKELPAQVKNMLIFTTFRPATFMGRPTAGTAVVSFSRISVKG